ncbi:MAG TPA: biopolymer transporter ExbD [Ramlibacter sp.]
MAVSLFSTGRAPREMAEMNITPLVDVMLVLLVIFMIASPVLTRTLDTRLPQTGPVPPGPPAERLRLQVTAGGEYLLRGQTLDVQALPAALAQEASRRPQPLLEIAANADADYQAMASALAEANRQQLRNVSLAD